LWIATDGGVTRYRTRGVPPRVRIKEVIAHRRYGSVEEIHIPSSQEVILFEFQGRSLTTRPDGMAYVVRLEGVDPEWKPNYTGRVAYHDLPEGDYTFQVKAVDRDLNYSEPVTVRVTVEPDPRLEALTEALSASGPKGEFVGESKALRKVQQALVEVAPTDLTVLILGETGTGKGLAAWVLHGLSARKAGPFVSVHCGGIPEALVESELFGHEKGAFTGAVSRKLGKVELAEGGTLFLDEIGDMPLETQVKLLHLLEERTFERVGGTEILCADVRIVAATNRDLRRMVREDTFREDLYFRLEEYVVEVPPLRDRREDIALLATYFTAQVGAHLDKELTHLTSEALSVLQSYDWPGNVRELEHAVRRAVIVSSGPSIRAQDISLGFELPRGASKEAILPLEEYERQYIRRVLEQTGWVIRGSRGAAALLGMPVSTLYSRMKKLGIDRP
jgi:transcriptional regulator with GAF, ATPase, and Fis domain